MSEIKPLTRQEMFDKTCELFKNQKVPSTNGEDKESGLYGCLYNGPNGTHSAVGNILSEEMQEMISNDPDWNGLAVSELTRRSWRIFKFLDYNRNEDFLANLQRIHDQAEKSTESENPLASVWTAVEMRMLAKTFDLDDSKVDWSYVMENTGD